MAKNVKRGGKAWKSGYTTYKAENRVKKNAIRRLERHLKNYPNDEAGKARLEEIRLERPYKRNNVKKSHTWSPGDIQYASIQGLISGASKHEMEYGQNRSRKASPSQMAETLSYALARNIDERLFGKG